jgi:hypothetical protein
MEKEKLFDALDGLYAHDTGCTDSGIKDELLKEQVKDYLNDLDDNDFRLIMSEFIREQFVSEEAISKGYGIEDVGSFLRWLDDELSICLY